jgi:preprotein translocase subunit SecF
VKFSELGNDLYSGERSIPVVPHRRRFYVVSLVVMAIALLGLLGRGLNLSLEFRGGSEFRVATTSAPADYEALARDAVSATGEGGSANVTKLGTGTIRVQTERLSDEASAKVKSSLASSFGVADTDVSATFIGPSWGASVSQKALQALVIFLLLVALVMAIYFRTWKMALAALIALAHDMVITVGIYALTGFEVSPATMIGFLTVLGYSIYDTVVVFDKVRENTAEAFANGRMSYGDAANLAVNQTLVRSINTTMVGILPILAVLVVGAVWLGPGVLLDLSLVLFIGLIVGAYSSIFIATPLLVSLRQKEEKVLDLAKRAERSRAARAKAAVRTEPGTEGATTAAGEPAAYAPAGAVGTDPAEATTVSGRAVHKWAQTGPRNQPKRTPKSRR